VRFAIISLALLSIILLGCAKATDPLTVEDKSVLMLENTYQTVGVPWDMIVTGSSIFLAEDQGGLSIFDRASGELATRMTRPDEFSYFQNIRQLGYNEFYDYLYVYDRYGPARIYVFDVSDIYDIPDFLHLITGDTDRIHYLYTKSDEEGSLEVGITYTNSVFRYGVTDYPMYITQEAIQYNMPNVVLNFHIAGQYAYLAAAQRGLYIFDLENGSLVSELNMTGEVLDVRVQGDYAYMVAKQEGLLIADISDKTNPQWINSKSTVGWAQAVDVEGDYLVVGSGGGGAYLYDIGQDPSDPKLLQRLTSSETDYVLLVAIENSRVFVVGRYQGISEYSINP